MQSFKSFITESTSFSGKVYHGSGSRFNEFKQSKARIPNDFYGGGVAYFTDNLSVAITYAKSMGKKSKDGEPFIYTVNLRLKKMFDVDDVFSGNDLKEILPDDVEEFARDAGLLGRKTDKYLLLFKLSSGNISLKGDQVFKGLSNGMAQTAKARQYLMDKGYDGLRYNGGDDMGMKTKHNVYLVYDVKNLKLLKRQIVRKKN